MTSPPPIVPQKQSAPLTEALARAILAGLAIHHGEPLIDPARIVYSIARPTVEAGAGRSIAIEFVVDELNPFGRVDIIVEG